MTTLDHEVCQIPPTLLKIDVEGFESEVLAGGSQTLANLSLQAIIIEANGSGAVYGFDEPALHRNIRDHGFTPCAYAPFQRCLTTMPPEAGGNIIYVRDLDTAKQRLNSAPPFHFHGASV